MPNIEETVVNPTPTPQAEEKEQVAKPETIDWESKFKEMEAKFKELESKQQEQNKAPLTQEALDEMITKSITKVTVENKPKEEPKRWGTWG